MKPGVQATAATAAGKAYLAGAGAGLLARALSLVAAFGNLWLLTRILSKEQFAGYVFVMALLTWLAMVGTAGLDRTILFRLARQRDEPGALPGGPLVASALAAVVPFSTLLAVLVAYAVPAAGWSPLPGLTFWLAALAPLLVLTCAGRVFEAWFVARSRVGPAVLIPAIGDIARTAALTIAFFALPTRYGVVTAVLAGALVPLVLWAAVAPLRTLRRGEGIGRADVSYGMQAMLAKATNEGAHQIDVLMLGVLATAAATADYAVAARLAALVSVVKGLLAPVLAPRLARHAAAGEREALVAEYRQVQLVGLVAALACAAAFAGAGRLLLEIFEGYERSYPLLLILTAGYVVNAGFGSNAAYLTVTGHAGWTLAARLVLLAAIVVMNVVLIPRYGAMGAALSVALGMTAVNGLMSAIIWRVDRIPTTSPGLLLVLAAGFTLLVLGGFEWIGGLPVAIGLAGLTTLLLAAGLPRWVAAARQVAGGGG